MRDILFAVLFLSCCCSATAQAPAKEWQLVKDAKGACQITVPPDWSPFGDAPGAAVLHDPATAIAVVTSQLGQTYKPLTDAQLKTLAVPKDKVFENAAARLFYQDKSAANADDSNAYSVMTAGRGGACSCHIVFTHAVAEDVARKVALSIGPAPEEKP